MYSQFQIIAFTHTNLSVDDIGYLQISKEVRKARLSQLKEKINWSELVYLSTCNRVEFILVGEEKLNLSNIKLFLNQLYPNMDTDRVERMVEGSKVYQGGLALDHILKVASSIDSMVVGEREIITQVRNAYDEAREMELSGDFLRLVIKQTITTAKKVYTETNISRNPVSVVSLAYHRMKDLNIPLDARILIIGAGATNTTLSRFLKKHGYKNFAVFNRTFTKAETLAKELSGNAYPLTDLPNYEKGFDVLICCTGTDIHLVSPEIYSHLLQGDESRKLVIDIAIPQDLDPEIIEKHSVHHISVSMLQKISEENLKVRSSEIHIVESIIQEAGNDFSDMIKIRSVEIAMREVPKKVKEIKTAALNGVFKSEIEALNLESREVLEKIMGYMEKKYMSVPMIMAKEILLKKN
ncbi:MAG: glutamyl-tRNA reductase [Psychromonas sp.]|jgi:glutamyl-tRNA reductase